MMGRDDDREPPHNLEAERAVLGSMMVSNSVIGEVSQVLSAEDFYRSVHSLTYQATMAVFSAGVPVDAITVADELRRRGHLDIAGGPLGVHDLVSEVSTPASALHYARIVADHSIRRSILRGCQETETAIFEGRDDDVGGLVETLVRTVTAKSQRKSHSTAEDIANRVLEDIEEAQHGSFVQGISTGFDFLDRAFGGFSAGNVTVLAAKTGHGKTSFALQVARHVAQERPVLFFSLEMEARDLGHKLASLYSKVNWRRVVGSPKHQPDEEGWSRLYRGATDIGDLKLDVFDGGSQGIPDIRARVASTPDCGLVIVDYLQLLAPPDYLGRNATKEEKVSELSRGLKVISMDYRVPVLVLSQFNRVEAGQEPTLENLRHSGSIEQDCSHAIFLYAKNKTDGQVKVYIPKNRFGPTPSKMFEFDKAFSRFSESAIGESDE